jgi:hypothetical protein
MIGMNDRPVRGLGSGWSVVSHCHKDRDALWFDRKSLVTSLRVRRAMWALPARGPTVAASHLNRGESSRWNDESIGEFDEVRKTTPPLHRAGSFLQYLHPLSSNRGQGAALLWLSTGLAEDRPLLHVLPPQQHPSIIITEEYGSGTVAPPLTTTYHHYYYHHYYYHLPPPPPCFGRP